MVQSLVCLLAIYFFASSVLADLAVPAGTNPCPILDDVTRVMTKGMSGAGVYLTPTSCLKCYPDKFFDAKFLMSFPKLSPGYKADVERDIMAALADLGQNQACTAGPERPQSPNFVKPVQPQGTCLPSIIKPATWPTNSLTPYTFQKLGGKCVNMELLEGFDNMATWGEATAKQMTFEALFALLVANAALEFRHCDINAGNMMAKSRIEANKPWCYTWGATKWCFPPSAKMFVWMDFDQSYTTKQWETRPTIKDAETLGIPATVELSKFKSYKPTNEELFDQGKNKCVDAWFFAYHFGSAVSSLAGVKTFVDKIKNDPAVDAASTSKEEYETFLLKYLNDDYFKTERNSVQPGAYETGQCDSSASMLEFAEKAVSTNSWDVYVIPKPIILGLFSIVAAVSAYGVRAFIFKTTLEEENVPLMVDDEL